VVEGRRDVVVEEGMLWLQGGRFMTKRKYREIFHLQTIDKRSGE
jgi:hypothetical protein